MKTSLLLAFILSAVLCNSSEVPKESDLQVETTSEEQTTSAVESGVAALTVSDDEDQDRAREDLTVEVDLNTNPDVVAPITLSETFDPRVPLPTNPRHGKKKFVLKDDEVEEPRERNAYYFKEDRFDNIEKESIDLDDRYPAVLKDGDSSPTYQYSRAPLFFLSPIASKPTKFESKIAKAYKAPDSGI